MRVSDAELFTKVIAMQSMQTFELQTAKGPAARIWDPEAETAHQQLLDDIRDISVVLARIPAETFAGLVAKASAVVSMIDQTELAAADALLEYEHLGPVDKVC